MKLFYANGKVQTLLLPEGGRQLFRRERDVLAERGLNASISCTDGQASHLAVLQSNRVLNMAYAPYGGGNYADMMSAIAYSGYYLDAFTKQYVLGNGYRRYCCSLMRFLNPDVLSPFDQGGVNAYAYCGGNPVGRVDPTGQSWQKAVVYIHSPSGSVRAKLAPGYKKILDQTLPLDMPDIYHDELLPLLEYRSARNALRNFIKGVKAGVRDSWPDGKGVGPEDHLEVTKDLYDYRQIQEGLLSLNRHYSDLGGVADSLHGEMGINYKSTFEKYKTRLITLRTARNAAEIRLGASAPQLGHVRATRF
jgi:RHS repeat-associated protein